MISYLLGFSPISGINQSVLKIQAENYKTFMEKSWEYHLNDKKYFI